MKSLLFALLVASPLAAEGVSPTASALAAQARPLTPSAAAVAAAPQELTRSAAARPAPALAAFNDAEAVHTGFYVPYWSAALHLAGAMPLATTSTYNSLGFGAQLDAIYHPADSVGLDVFALMASMPSIDPTGDGDHVYLGSSIPTSVMGLGLKGAYTLYKADQMALIVDGGLGYGSVERTQRTVTSPSGQWPIVWHTGSSQTGGLLMVVGLQVTYQIVPELNLVMALDYVAVNLAGGTGDTPQMGLPSVGVQYDFE
jgi:hypothetical protein